MKKKFLTKLIAFLLILAMAIPMVLVHTPDTVYAASASMNTSWRTIIMGDSYTFWVKNASNVKTRSWSSSKPSIATVNGKGKVTPVKAGKTTISCKLVFTNGSTQTVSATVAVKARIPSTAISLNANLGTINAHTIKVGESFQFKVTKTPASTTDYAYFVIADEEYASVTTAGVVTAKKAGITMLEVYCGLNATDAKRVGNTAYKRVYLNITASDVSVTPTITPTPTPTEGAKNITVTSVSLASSKELRIDFSNEILASSIIDSNGDLITGTVTIGLTPGASSFNSITPTLSKDKRTLLLTASGNFEGTYVVTISESILATNSTPVTPYTVQKTLKDEVGPSYISTDIDDTGYISTINFSEPVDISSLSIYNVVGTTNTSLQSYLTNAANYTLSADKKSLSINLGATGVTSANVLVSMVGIKDIIGNVSSPFTLQTIVEIDATTKPNATIISVTRTSKNIVTATFNRPIQYAGYMYVGTDYVTGVVDPANSTKVNYTLSNTSLTGTQMVKMNGWFSFNSTSTQTTEVQRAVNFTLDTTAPLLISSSLASGVENKVPVLKLTLNYNKEVTLLNGNGTLTAKIVSTNSNIYNKQMNFSAIAKGKVVTLTFENQVTETGTYSFDLPASLVMDQYENFSIATSITVGKQTSSSTALPAPLSMLQDPTNPSKIIIKFGQKLDIASASNIANYIVGTSARPSSATVVAQDDSSATIELTFASNAIPTTGTYPVTVKGIKGFNDSYAEMNIHNTILTLVENGAPTFQSARLTSAYTINVTFSENFTGTATITTYNGSSEVGSAHFINGKELIITLDQPITSTAYIMFTNNEFVDANNNKANVVVNKKIAVSRAY